MGVDQRAQRVIVAEPFSKSGLNVLRSAAVDVVECSSGDRDGLIDAMQGADGLIVRSQTRVDAALISGAPTLKVIGASGCRR